VRGVVLTVAAVLAAGGGGEAEACSCVAGALAHPVAGAVDVPRNTVILWSAVESEAPIVRRAGGEEIAVDLEERRYDNYYGPVWLGRPAALLEAGASYEICALVGGSESCSGFTVGSAIDETAPELAAPTALHAQRLRNIDGECDARCWGTPSDALILDHAPASEAGFALIEVRREEYADLAWSFLRPIDPEDQRTRVFNTFCSPPVISLEEGMVYCSRMTAIDGAGNLGATTSEMCGAATTCETSLCEAPFDGSCPALATPDAGPHPDDSADTSGCAVAGRGHSLLAVLGFGALGFLRRRRRSCPLS
jgi:MYXO-CTERM domain-containing protein